MFAHRKLLILSSALAMLIAPNAAADGFGITFGKHGKHTSFGFEFTSGGFCEPAPPPVYCPPQVWVPGHYDTVLQEVWIEGPKQQVWCGPVFEWRHDACGHAFKVLVSPGHWKTVCAPGHMETRRVQVWQPGHWQNGGMHAQ